MVVKAVEVMFRRGAVEVLFWRGAKDDRPKCRKAEGARKEKELAKTQYRLFGCRCQVSGNPGRTGPDWYRSSGRDNGLPSARCEDIRIGSGLVVPGPRGVSGMKYRRGESREKETEERYIAWTNGAVSRSVSHTSSH